MSSKLKIGQEVLIHGYVDEIRKDIIIIRNEGGYFGTVEAEITSETAKSDFAQERYQDLIDYFGDKEAKIILEDRKEFREWLERLKWHVKKVDELTRGLLED